MQLTPCPECARHVRVGEPACPFCGHEARFVAAPRPRLPGRLGRAAIFAFRTAVIGAAGASTACGSATGLVDPEHRADAAVAPADASGVPGPRDAGPMRQDAGPMGDEDAGGSIALYGGPGVDPDPIDASGPDDGGIQALYGGPGPAPEPVDAGGSNINLYGGPPAS